MDKPLPLLGQPAADWLPWLPLGLSATAGLGLPCEDSTGTARPGEVLPHPLKKDLAGHWVLVVLGKAKLTLVSPVPAV